ALAAVAAGLALSAVQLLPTAYVATRGIRQGLSYSQAMSYSLPVPQLPMLAFPYLFGKSVAGGPYAHLYGGIWNLTELSGYPGMAILVLAGAGAAALRRNRPARALAVTGTVALLLALGPATPLSRLLFAVPPFGGFRAWGRFIVGFDLALAMLAAYGTSRLRGTGPGRRTALIAAAGTAAAVGMAALVVPHLAAVARYLPHGHAAPAALLLPTAFAVAGAVGGPCSPDHGGSCRCSWPR
ncbi:MAG TPA: hypothetical protein VHA57_04125, partial [Actinomycetota bacterium]|nr:hypothetical protein [Actinomycetota bacterium]